MSQITLPSPADRTRLLGFSDIVKIRNRVLDLRQKGVPVIQLEGGEPFLPTPDFIKQAMKDALESNKTRYAPSSGIPELLDAIREKLRTANSIPAERENLIVVNGGMHGLACAFQASLNEGDETIFFSPYWTPIRDLVGYAGARAVRVPWSDLRGSDVKDLLEKKITPRTRVLYVNSPANPTGDVLTRPQLKSISEVAIEHNLLVISDEAYEDLVYDGSHVSIGSLPGMFERTISVYTLSKSYSMTGWRIGYVAAPAPFMDVIRRLVLNSTNGVSTPTQWAALAALSEGADHLASARPQYRERRDLLSDGLGASGFLAPRPAGAFYLLVDVRERLGNDSWEAMNTLLERTGIATVPGAVFGAEGEGRLRMSYSNSISTIEAAIEAMKKL